MNAKRLLALFDRVSEAPDAVPKLRRFVLDLAVRGKLVEQDPADEPAGGLLQKIEAERARLIKAKALRDRLVLPPVTIDDEPFPVPGSWCWTRFANIADFSAGRTPSRTESSFWNNGDHAWVSIADIEDGLPLAVTKETVSDNARERVFGSEPEPVGTILMSFKLTIGKICRLAIPAFHNEAIISIRPHIPAMDSYLFKMLPRFARQGDTKGAIKGATLNRDSISNIIIPLPPLAEQHRIVTRVDELMALCDQLEAARADREHRRDRLAETVLNRLDAPVSDPATFANDARFVAAHLSLLSTRTSHVDRLRATILELAVKGRLGTQDTADATGLSAPRDDRLETSRRRAVKANQVQAEPLQAAYSLPETWRWERLADLTDTMDAGWSPQCESHPRRDVNRWGVLKTTAVQVLQFDQSQHKELPEKLRPRPQFEAKLGDILVTRAGPKNRVGIVCVVDEVGPRLMISDKLIRIRVNSAASPEFVALALNAGFSRDCVEAAKSGMAVMQMNISQDKLKAVPIPLPPLAEQRRIVARVDELMALCDQLEASLAAADAANARLLDAILHEALNGPADARETEAA
jgi:type I restriction enzyme S subunit